MNITINWQKEIVLLDGAKSNLIYDCDASLIPEKPGVYIFARLHGGVADPIYIGESLVLRKRIEQHLKYVPLMKQVENRKQGKRVLMYGTLQTGRGIRVKSALQRVERGLIKYALAQGATLVNWKGTRTPYDTISFTGNLEIRPLFGTKMNIERRVN